MVKIMHDLIKKEQAKALCKCWVFMLRNWQDMKAISKHIWSINTQEKRELSWGCLRGIM